MRLISFVVLLLISCARNADTDADESRVRDTTLTAADTVNPGDTLDRARRPVPDTAGGLDTTSRR